MMALSQAARGAPHHLARQRHARVVIREHRRLRWQAHQIAQPQALQVVQRAREQIDARALGIDDALAPTPTPAGCLRGVDEPADRPVQFHLKGVQVRRRPHAARRHDSAVLIHHAGLHVGAADIDAEDHHRFPAYPSARR